METPIYQKTRGLNRSFIFLFSLAVFLFALSPVSQSDTGTIIKTGEYIISHWSVPRVDIFSLSAGGAQFIAHFWLAAVIFYFLDAINPWTLIIFSALFTSASAILFLLFGRRLSGSLLLPAVLLPPLFALTLELWVPRAQIFSYLGVILLLIYLNYFPARHHSRLFLSFLPLLFLLWANLHAGVILGLLILTIFIATHFRASFFRPLLTISFISLLATFLNPNGFYLHLYPLLIKDVIASLGVMEWNSLLSFSHLLPARFFLTLIIIISSFIIFRLFSRRFSEPDDYFTAALLVLAVALPLTAIRQTAFFPILVFPILCREIKWRPPAHFLTPLPAGILSGILLFIFLLFGVQHARATLAEGAFNRHSLPVGAADFIIKNNLPAPIFNLENGGYLIYRLFPDYSIFFDNRNEVYRGAPLSEYLTIARRGDGWENLFNDKYNFQTAVLWYRPPLDSLAAGLSHDLFLRGWRLVFWDDAAIVLVRGGTSSTTPYQIINPFIAPDLIPPDKRRAAAAELSRALEISPDSLILRAYTTRLLSLPAQ